MGEALREVELMLWAAVVVFALIYALHIVQGRRAESRKRKAVRRILERGI